MNVFPQLGPSRVPFGLLWFGKPINIPALAQLQNLDYFVLLFYFQENFQRCLKQQKKKFK